MTLEHEPPAAAGAGAPAGLDELLGARVLIVTGKGGVGKTTAAGAIGLAGAASGRRTLLVELEGRDGISRALRTPPWTYEGSRLGPDLWGMSVDPAAAVYEYLELFYGLKRVQWVMERSNALDLVTTTAPGLRDLLLVGKVYELEARRRQDGRRTYDLIVVDAPPTGRIVPFLRAPEAVTEIVRAGPIRRQAGQIAEMLHDPGRTRAILVTLLEELPVTETQEAITALRGAAIATGPVIANQVQLPLLDDDQMQRLVALGSDRVQAIASDAGARMSAPTSEHLLALARDHRHRQHHQHERRQQLAATADRVLGLPLLPSAEIGPAELRLLADVLVAQLGGEAPDAEEAYDASAMATLAGGGP